MPNEKGEMLWVPDNAIVIYTWDTTRDLFGHAIANSTRKTMSRWGWTMVRGYPMEEVDWALEHRDPNLSGWSRKKGSRTRNTEE